MPRKTTTLTVEAIKKATPHPDGKSYRWFGDGQGLNLQVAPGRTKSWIVRYTINGRTRATGIGTYPELSLEAARKVARSLKFQVDNGVDPIEEKRAAKQVRIQAFIASQKEFQQVDLPPCGNDNSFKKWAEGYIENRSIHWSKKSQKQWRASLEKHVFPYIGNDDIDEISSSKLIRVLEKIWLSRNETASRLAARIERIFAWSRVKRDVKGENPAKWHRNLQEAFPPRSEVHKVTHHSALPYTEMPPFMRRIGEFSHKAGYLLRFIILTTTRTGEARAAKWEEIDFQTAIWTIPAIRMKGRRIHRVPLSSAALALLLELKAENDRLESPSEFVFPGQKFGRCLSDGAALWFLKHIERTDITPHGMRSTARDYWAACTDFPVEVQEAQLAHLPRSEVVQAYQRGDFLEKRRALVEHWGNYCLSGSGQTRLTVRELTATKSPDYN